MSLRFSLVSSELDAEDLQALTRDFCGAANREDGLLAELVHGAAAPGAKAVDTALIGNLALTFLSSGAAVAFINVCKSFFERTSSLEMSVEREDGRKLSIKAQNVESGQIASTLETVREFFGAAG
ncbi:MAG: hypothetical protein HY822_06675 [Acidobacteria bacterium]|nr:hypothetical protein [Acidobacteriota bacterium]